MNNLFINPHFFKLRKNGSDKMSNDLYIMPITQEYDKRGCHVSINAAANSNGVDITVTNLKTNYTGYARYVLMPGREREWYNETDIREIQNMINSLLDTYGDQECNEIHFTNQILS